MQGSPRLMQGRKGRRHSPGHRDQTQTRCHVRSTPASTSTAPRPRRRCRRRHPRHPAPPPLPRPPLVAARPPPSAALGAPAQQGAQHALPRHTEAWAGNPPRHDRPHCSAAFSQTTLLAAGACTPRRRRSHRGISWKLQGRAVAVRRLQAGKGVQLLQGAQRQRHQGTAELWRCQRREVGGWVGGWCVCVERGGGGARAQQDAAHSEIKGCVQQCGHRFVSALTGDKAAAGPLRPRHAPPSHPT